MRETCIAITWREVGSEGKALWKRKSPQFFFFNFQTFGFFLSDYFEHLPFHKLTHTHTQTGGVREDTPPEFL